MILSTLLLFVVPQANYVVDATKSKPISPYIYGANHPDWDKLKLPLTLARQGGNRMTAYNWETNASNAGNDFHHQNDNYLGDTDESGWTVKTFLDAAQSHGAAVIITVPTAGYVSADKKGDGDVNKTPDYLNVRYLKSLASKPGRKYVYPPDTTDKLVFQDEFAHWIWGVRSKKTPVWFSLDNEPDLWHSTHVRIVPKNLTYAQIIANNTEFATSLKTVAPDALIFGPANYGWQGFRRFQGASDANGRDFLDVYLAAMKAAGKKIGKRLVDVLDIHWYPEARGDDVRIDTDQDKPGTPAARIQAPRSLWDQTYVETSWITQSTGGKPIALLPGVLKQIEAHYPGTKLSITEYNYGGRRVISGALAQADVLGLFGRYGLFAACNWGITGNDIGQVAGFRAFLDFDGKGARFGDIGLSLSGEQAAEDSLYASVDSKDSTRLTLVAINKTKGPRSMQVLLKGFSGRSARAFVVNADSLPNFKPLGSSLSSGSVSFTAPGESIVAVEIRSR